jgi:RNA 2',3'-cyclic 3'-phosphodiesterase
VAGIRTFIAIKLDDRLCTMLDAIAEDLQDRMPARAVRWTDARKIHLTLKFLGDVAPSQIDPIEAALRVAAGQIAPFTFELTGAGCFPNNSRPRVVWVGVSEPSHTLDALQRVVESELRNLGFEAERRPFSPHLTLGRVRNDVSPHALREIGQIVESTLIGSIGRQRVGAVHLFKSDLRPQGALYTPLAEAPLAEAER